MSDFFRLAMSLKSKNKNVASPRIKPTTSRFQVEKSMGVTYCLLHENMWKHFNELYKFLFFRLGKRLTNPKFFFFFILIYAEMNF